MDPLLDEKIIVTLSQIIPEFFYENFEILFKREAFGPSLNEGICYEFTCGIEFEGDFSGRLFLCMDGATKLKFLPHLSKHYHIDTYKKGMANSILMEISNQIASLFIEEFSYAKFSLEIKTPETWNQKVFLVDFDIYRQYMLIFNIYYNKQQLGRIYYIILLKK